MSVTQSCRIFESNLGPERELRVVIVSVVITAVLITRCGSTFPLSPPQSVGAGRQCSVTGSYQGLGEWQELS